MIHPLRLLAAGIALSLAVAASTGRAAEETRTLAVPGRANANLSLASSGSFAAIVWSATPAGGQADVFAATSRDGGYTFSLPVRVNSGGGEVLAKGEQPPRIALVPRPNGEPTINVVWVANRANQMVLLSSRSKDGGASYSASTLVAGSNAAGMRGWQSIAADARGDVLTVWLDHRRMAEHDAEMAAMHDHQAAVGPPSTASMGRPQGATMAMSELSQLYVSIVGGESPRPVTSGVCFCCKTAIAAGPAGELYLAWRHVYSGNLRDMAFTSSHDGGRTFATPTRVSEDGWVINGCPEDGPSLAVDRQSRVHIVWPTVVSENGDPVKAVFHAVTRDGRTFSERTRLPSSGQANHPQITTASDGSLFVAWDESGSGARQVRIARGVPDANGHVSFERNASSTAREGTYPAVTALNEGVLLAWTTGPPAASTIRMEVIR